MYCLFLNSAIFAFARRKNFRPYLWPVLRSMEDATDLNRAVCHTVNGYVGQGREHQLPPSMHSTAGPSKIRKVFESLASLEDGLGHAPYRFRVVVLNAVANTFQVFRRR